MLKVMWLDDMRPCPNPKWFWAHNVAEAKAYILINGMPDHICFDHDIGIDTTGLFHSGFDLAKWMVQRDQDNIIDIPAHFTYSVQSANPTGRENIIGLLDGYIKHKHGHESSFTQSWPSTS